MPVQIQNRNQMTLCSQVGFTVQLKTPKPRTPNEGTLDIDFDNIAFSFYRRFGGVVVITSA